MAKTEKVAKPKVDRRKSVKSAATVSQPAPAAVTVSVSETEIARRAFEVFCARGGQPGRALDDWLQAERELTAEVASSAR